MIRADLIVYYWIVLWYLFYLTGYLSQNPAPALWVSFITHLFMLVLLIYYNVKMKTIVSFVLVIFVLHVIPLWTLQGIPMGKKDIMATIGLYIMYIGWLVWEDKLSLVKQITVELLHDKYSTPAMIGFVRLFS